MALSKELIKSTGMKCQTASNGEEALEKLKIHDFHLVLTDIQMPKMDGFAFIKALKAQPEISNIPVIAISGRTNVSAEKYKEAGFAGNILKPYKPADLLLKIGQIFKVEFENKKDQAVCHHLRKVNIRWMKYFYLQVKIKWHWIQFSTLSFKAPGLTLKRSKAEKLGDRERVAQIAHRMLPMFKQLKIKEIVPRLEQLEKKEGVFYDTGSMELLIEEIEVLLFELQKEVKA